MRGESKVCYKTLQFTIQNKWWDPEQELQSRTQPIAQLELKPGQNGTATSPLPIWRRSIKWSSSMSLPIWSRSIK